MQQQREKFHPHINEDDDDSEAAVMEKLKSFTSLARTQRTRIGWGRRSQPGDVFSLHKVGKWVDRNVSA